MLAEWWNRFVASDPGLRRFRAACRVALALILMLIVVVPTLQAAGQPIPIAMFGAIVAININMNAADPTRAQQKVTTLLCPIAAVLALTLATATRTMPLLSVILFLAVIFVAVYIRRFGQRWFALGMLAFMGFFFAQFIKPTFAQLPWIALAAVAAAAATYAAKFWLLRETPERNLSRGLRTLREQVHAMLHAVHDRAQRPEAARPRRMVHNRAVRLNETALMLEGNIAALDDVTNAQRDELRRRILDVELSAENLLTLLLQLLGTSGDRDQVTSTVADLFDVLRRDPEVVQAASRELAERVESEGAPYVAMAVRRLGRALADLAETTSDLVNQGYRAEPDQAEEEAAWEERQNAAQAETGWRRPELRAAVQVTIAAALAITFGQLVSPNRWYWAVITAFLVFIGAKSRGEIMVRAWQRTAGTILGVIAGIVVASRIAGDTRTELALIVVCVFLAFYFAGYLYSALTFFITTALGLLYGVLGMFQISLLELRLEETAIGAAVGVVSALFILPTGTRRYVRRNAEHVLDGLRDLLDEAANEVGHGRVPGRLQSDARDVDTRLQTLLRSAAPLTRYRFRPLRSQSSRWLTIIRSCTYYSHNLTEALPVAIEMIDDDTRRRLAGLLHEEARLAEALSARQSETLAASLSRIEDHLGVLYDFSETLPEGRTSLRSTVHVLDRLQRTLQDLGGEMGVRSPTATRRAETRQVSRS